MPFPSPSLAPPALNLYQLSYGGLAFGGVGRTVNQVQSMVIDMPDVAGGDVQRAMDQGEFVGLDVLPGKDVTIVQTIGRANPTGFPVTAAEALALDQAVQALGGVMAPGGVTERPLYLQLPSGLFACMCRPRRHSCPFDINRVMAGGVIATTMLHATDPRWYAAPSKTATVGLPAPAGGLSFPVSFPATFGGGGAGGILTVYNYGLFEMRPVLVIAGPCTNPVVSNLSIPGAPAIGVALTLAAGDTLTIGTDLRSIVFTAAGTSAGSSRRNALMSGSTWWNLPPGANQIEFTTGDAMQVAGTLTVQSADAYLTL